MAHQIERPSFYTELHAFVERTIVAHDVDPDAHSAFFAAARSYAEALVSAHTGNAIGAHTASAIGIIGSGWVSLSTAIDDVQEFADAVDAALATVGEQAQDAVAALIQNGTGISWVYDDDANTLTPTVTLAPFSTTDLAEGANLYFTDERVDDRVAALIQNGTGLAWTYNDPANTLTGDVSLAPFSTTNLAEGANLYFTDERVDDRVAALIQNGTGLTWTYNDPANTLTGNVTLSEPANQIVYGTGSGFSSSSSFTYTVSTGGFSVNASGSVAAPGTVLIQPKSRSGAGTGALLSLKGGNAQAVGGTGGDVFIYSGTGNSGQHGSVFIGRGTLDALEIDGPTGEWFVNALGGNAGDILTHQGAAPPKWAAPTGGYTDEQAQDAVGGILVDSPTVDFTYDDPTPSIKADVRYQYAPGSYTVATGFARLHIKTLELTSTQRWTLQGTARLRII